MLKKKKKRTTTVQAYKASTLQFVCLRCVFYHSLAYDIIAQKYVKINDLFF